MLRRVLSGSGGRRPRSRRASRHAWCTTSTGRSGCRCTSATPTESRGTTWNGPTSPELKFLPRYQTRPGATVFDLGAHQGVYALMLANAVGQRGRVIAVEANQFNVDCLKVNCRLNKVRNVTAVHAAVAEEPGTVFFGRGNNGQVDTGGRHEDSQEVPAVTIDDLTRRYGRPAMLFLDIEGYECQALQGAPATLATRPDVFVEVHVGYGLEDFGGGVDELLEFFPEQDYELYGSNEIDRDPSRSSARAAPWPTTAST
jgi:FkbM family methyltransferase